MTITAANKVASYLESLAATNDICSEFGSTFSSSNLFIYKEPSTDSDVMTIMLYPGAPPDANNTRVESGIQLRMKATSYKKAMDTQQACIKKLNNNHLGGRGYMRATNSAPNLIDILEGGEYVVVVSNFTLKYTI